MVLWKGGIEGGYLHVCSMLDLVSAQYHKNTFMQMYIYMYMLHKMLPY